MTRSYLGKASGTTRVVGRVALVLLAVLVVFQGCKSGRDAVKKTGSDSKPGPSSTRSPSAKGPKGNDGGDGSRAVQVNGQTLPQAGRYTYVARFVGDESPGSPREFTVEFHEPAKSENGYRQTVDRHLRDNLVQRQTWHWSPSGLILESESFIFSSTESPPCRFKPAVPLLSFPLQIGSKWKGEGECGRGTVSQRRAIEAEVLRKEPTTITDGASLDTFVILQKERHEGTGFSPGSGATSESGVLTIWYSTQYGLRIKIHTQSESRQSQTEELLKSVKPES